MRIESHSVRTFLEPREMELASVLVSVLSRCVCWACCRWMLHLCTDTQADTAFIGLFSFTHSVFLLESLWTLLLFVHLGVLVTIMYIWVCVLICSALSDLFSVPLSLRKGYFSWHAPIGTLMYWSWSPKINSNRFYVCVCVMAHSPSLCILSPL